MTEDLRRFCSAPWTDCIAYADGSLRPCDRNNISFGNWQKDGLEQVWNNQALQDFREQVAEGTFPNQDCESCYRTGTYRWAQRSLGSGYGVHIQRLRAFYGLNLTALSDIKPYFYKRISDRGFEIVLKNYYNCLDQLPATDVKEIKDSLTKMRVIGDCLRDFLQGNKVATRVAPFRQIQITAKCNSRCIMCVGNFTDEIRNGPTMPDEHILGALTSSEDVLDFFSNGSEFLLHRNWRALASKLAGDCGTQLRFSTNGILLAKSAIEFLIDRKIIETLTVSLDGATKETVEAIRVNVKYDSVLESMRYLSEYSLAKRYKMQLVLGFVFMRRNYHELPQFIQMAHRMRNENPYLNICVLIQTLENMNVEEYRKFVHQEHHDLIPALAKKQVLEKAYTLSKQLQVPATFYGQSLQLFMNSGGELPRFFVRDTDRALFRGKKQELQLRIRMEGNKGEGLKALQRRRYLNSIERQIVNSAQSVSDWLAELEAQTLASPLATTDGANKNSCQQVYS